MTVLVFALLTIACDGGVPVSDFLADLEGYEGATIWVRGDVVTVPGCTDQACPGSDPCNSCFGTYAFADGFPPSTFVVLTPGADWSYPTFPGTEEEPILGCAGDEALMECAPAVPGRIRGAYGRLRRGFPDWAFEVETLDLEDAPREGVAGSIRLIELSP